MGAVIGIVEDDKIDVAKLKPKWMLVQWDDPLNVSCHIEPGGEAMMGECLFALKVVQKALDKREPGAYPGGKLLLPKGGLNGLH
jgi:hypothetical protein